MTLSLYLFRQLSPSKKLLTYVHIRHHALQVGRSKEDSLYHGQQGEDCPPQARGVDQTTNGDADAGAEDLTRINKDPLDPSLHLGIHRSGQSPRGAPNLRGTEYMAGALPHKPRPDGASYCGTKETIY